MGAVFLAVRSAGFAWDGPVVLGSALAQARMTDSQKCNVESPRTLFIHGGMHKTGSSAIQKYLYEHLDHPQFEYLSAGRANASNIVLEAFHCRLDRIPRYKARNHTQQELAGLRVNARDRFKKRFGTRGASR